MTDYSKRVQEYLNKYNVNILFEEMMTKLVKDMPEEPVGFLIHILQRKAQKLGLLPKGSQGEPGMTRSTSHDIMRKTIAGDNVTSEIGRDRQYDKPWQTNSRKVKVSSATAPRAEWDGRTKIVAGSFDDMRSQTLPIGIENKQMQLLLQSSQNVQDVMYKFYGMEITGPVNEEEFMKGELSLSKEKKIIQEEDKSKKPLIKKPKDVTMQAVNHKKELAKKIEDAKQQTHQDSGYEDEKDIAHHDYDAVELIESAEDLLTEGVTKVSSKTSNRTAVRAIVPQPAAVAPPPLPQVKVIICARCARVLEETESSAIPRAFAAPKDSDNDMDKEQPISFPYFSRPNTADFSRRMEPTDSDEDFESVSQVSGPRHPVWHDESRGKESKSARKETKSSSIANQSSKSARRTSSGSDVAKRHTPRLTESTPTIDMFLKSSSNVASKTRSPISYQDPRISEDETMRPSAAAWQANIDDSDSSAYGISGRPYTKDKRTY